MKGALLLLACAALMFPVAVTAQDNPPTVVLAFPPPESDRLPHTLTLVAYVEDRDSSATFDVYFGTTPNPQDLVYSESLSILPFQVLLYQVGPLAPLTTYYWKVVGRDPEGATAVAESYFTTWDRMSNLPPIPAYDPAPADDAVVTTALTHLRWRGADPEWGYVRYDVYFGTDPSPPFYRQSLLLGSSRTTGSVFPPALVTNTRYYWRVVGRDEGGAETTGPVWSFLYNAEVSVEPTDWGSVKALYR